MKTNILNRFGKILMVMVVFFLVFYSMPVMAENGYAENTGSKLTRGLINIVTGWVEFPKQIYEVSRDKDVVVGITYGSIKGVADTVIRTGAGVYETATFYAPLPSDYEPLKESEYVWEG